jgi:hypothetical protein
MSKLRKWLMKEEEEQAASPPVTADPAIKLFGRTIPVTGGGAVVDADIGEVITDDPNCPLQKGAPPCTEVGCLFSSLLSSPLYLRLPASQFRCLFTEMR